MADNLYEFFFAVGRAAIATGGIAIIALLTNALGAVAADSLCLYDTGCRTAIARRGVAIIAFLAGIEDAIATVGIAVVPVVATGGEGTA